MADIKQLLNEAGYTCPADPAEASFMLANLMRDGIIPSTRLEELAGTNEGRIADGLERVASSLDELGQAVNSIGELLDNRLSSR